MEEDGIQTDASSRMQTACAYTVCMNAVYISTLSSRIFGRFVHYKYIAALVWALMSKLGCTFVSLLASSHHPLVVRTLALSLVWP